MEYSRVSNPKVTCMHESIIIPVTVQLERLGGQLVRARPLGPWRAQVVGSSRQEVCRRIEQRLHKLLPKSLPSQYFEAVLPDEPKHWITSVELNPLDRSQRWADPIRVELDSFRWILPSGQCVVRVPAVSCVLFGKPDELDDAEVERQAKIALTRTVEGLDLVELRQRFRNREYEFRMLRIRIPMGAEADSKKPVRDERKRTSTLRSVASDLTAAELQPVYGLDALAAQLAEHFVGESPQSVLLVGPAGVGKTSLVHRLVKLRHAVGLGTRKIWTTSGARIVSGMSGLGMWQQRCSNLIRQAHATHAIIHFGSLFELMEAGKIDGQPGVGSMVRTSIGRRRLLAIAECTPEQLAVVEKDDPLLLRAFTKVELREPGGEQVIEILRQAAGNVQGKNAFTDQAIEELYRLHSRYASYSALPAVALRLMRTMDEYSTADVKHGAEDVARAFSRQTGLPRFLVDDSVKLDLEKLRHSLTENVIGQQEPVDLIVDLIATLKARLVRPGRPLAALMFIGPTGVGKTEMAKAIARLLYSDANRMIRIDMSEYASPWSVAKLIGKPGEGDGTLTSPIREQPFSVVLLDEFEKADSHIFDLLLQLLGEGRLTDSHGRLADFRNAVVIMTSNLGAESFREASFGFGSDAETTGWREHFQREVRKFVRPEFLGRIDRIVPFAPLPRDIVRKIALRELQILTHRTGLKYSGSVLQFDEAAVDLLCEIGYKPKYGARPLRRAIEENVTVPLADALSRLTEDCTWKFKVDAGDGRITIQPEKLTSKTESVKEKEAALINSWQQLATMARAAKNSGPLRNLENELERNIRHNGLLKNRIKSASGPRRLAALKEQLARGQAAVTVAKRLRSKLFRIADRIGAQHLELMLAWHRNQTIDWGKYEQGAKTHTSVLRQVIEDVLKGRVTESNFITLLITGHFKAQLEIVWRAYQQIAEEHGWQLDKYLVKPYDPLLDKDSLEHRKRVSERKSPAALQAEQKPVLRLLSAATNEQGKQEKVCDLFRAGDDDDFRGKLAWATGVALQFGGDGVGSWLEDEYGTIHFFDQRLTGAKRRVRLKLSAFEGKMHSIELPSDWLEPVSQPERDPFRLVNLSSQEIVDNSGRTVSFAQGKLSTALAELITERHESALWCAIGYEGIPRDAQLHKEIAVTF